MNLTSQQVAEKLGVKRNVVARLAASGKLPPITPKHQTPSGRVNYLFDQKVVAEFKKTYVPVQRATAKTDYIKPRNGHAADVPLPFPGAGPDPQVLVRLERIETQLATLSEALTNLAKVWE